MINPNNITTTRTFVNQEISKTSLPPIEPERVIEAKNHATRLLVEKPAFTHHHEIFRSFIMLNSSASIKGSSYEGGLPSLAFSYWGALLKLLHFPIGHHLTPDQIVAAQAANDDLIYFEQFITVQTKPKDLVAEILKRAQIRKECFLPAGWIHVDESHFSSLKVRLLDDGRIALKSLDYGAGGIFHKPAGKGTFKNKYEFEDAEFVFVPASEECECFFSQLITLQRDSRPLDNNEVTYKGIYYDQKAPSNIKTINPYSAIDLYGALRLFGERLNEQQNEKKSDKGVTMQRSGTCPMTNTRAASRDVLQGKTLSPSGLKRFQFSMKLASLTEAFKAYKADPNVAPSDFSFYLLDAANELAVRTQKLYPEILTTEEVALCQEITNEIISTLEAKKKQDIAIKCDTVNLPATSTKERFDAEQTITSSAPASIQTAPAVVIQKRTLPPLRQNCEPENVREYLQQLLAYYKEQKDLRNDEIMVIRKYLHTLPLSSGQKIDPYWDNVPWGDVESIIELLNELAKLTITNSVSCDRPSFIHRSEIGMIAFDIAAQLSMRVDDLKLKDQFAFALDDVYSDQPFFHEAESYKTIKRIINNFKSRNDSKQPVFGHIIESEYSGTRAYVLNHLLSNTAKLEWCKKKKGEFFPKNYSDKELFLDLITSDEGLSEPFMPRALKSLVQLSSFVHNFGLMALSSYQKLDWDKDIVVNANSNSIRKRLFNQESEQEKKWQFRNLENPFLIFPDLPVGHDQTFGFHENSAFHPMKDLAKRRKECFNQALLMAHSVLPVGSYRFDFKGYDNTYRQIPEPLDEDFRVLESAPHLQVQKTLEWAQYHLDKLEDPYNQHRLFTLLFEYGKIEEAMRSSPKDFLALINIFQTKAFNHYLKQPDSLKTILWIAAVCHYLKDHVETIAADMPEVSLEQVNWIDTRTLLKQRFEKSTNSEERQSIAQHLIHSYMSQDKLTKEEYLSLLAWNGLVNMEYKSMGYHTHLDFIRFKLMLKHEASILETVTTLPPEELNRFGNTMLNMCLGLNKDSTWLVSGDTIVDADKKFSIDLRTGKIQKSQEDLQDILSHVKNDPTYVRLGCKCDAMTLNGNKATSIDNQWEFTLSISREKISINEVNRQCTIDGKAIAFKPQNDPKKIIDETCPPVQQDVNDYIFWEGTTPEEGILLEHVKSHTCHYYTPKEGWQELHNITAGQWQRSSTLFLNLHHPRNDFESSWANFLKPYDPPGKTIVKTSKTNEGSVNIESIQFSRHQLNFEPKLVKTRSGNAEQRLYSREHKGFYWLPQKGLPQLHGLQGVFILQNDEGEQKYLVPALHLQATGKDQVDFNHSLDSLSKENAYFVYQMNKQNELVGSTVAANLYLAIIYRGMRDFRRAMDCLERTEHHANNTLVDWTVSEELKSLNESASKSGKLGDFSPAGAAFDCHFAYRMKRHQTKWSHPADQLTDQNPAVFKLAEEMLDYYRSSVSEYKEDVSAVPEFLRLKECHFRAFEKTFRQTGSTVQLEVGHGHTDRLKEIETLTYLDDKEGITKKTDFDKICYFDDTIHIRQEGPRIPFTRIYFDPAKEDEKKQRAFDAPGNHYLKKYFVNLFEDATSRDAVRRRRCRADLFYLINNDLNFTDETQALACSLLYVLNHSSQFNLGPFRTSKECFEAVCSRCFDLESQARSLTRNPMFPTQNQSIQTTRLLPLSNPHLPAQQVHMAFAPIDTGLSLPMPLQKIYGSYFDDPKANQRPIATRPFVLKDSFPKEAKLEKKLF